MTKVLLIDPPWYVLQNQDNYIASLGLAYLGAYLRAKGHDVLIYNGEFGFEPQSMKGRILVDYNYYLSNLESDENPYISQTFDNIGELMKKHNPTIVGITVPTAKYILAARIAEKVKEINPNIKIIVGGPHPTDTPEQTLGEKSFDIVARREAEIPFANVVEAIEKGTNLKNIKGISYKENGKIIHNPDEPYLEDLDKLPFPAWDLFYRWKEHHPDAFGGILTTRGCPYDCNFCASKRIWTRRARDRTVPNIIAEIKRTHEKFKTKIFRINDDTFTLDRERVVNFCNELIKLGLHKKIKWLCDTRTNHIDLKLLKLMKKAGCFHINFGIESGNPEILKLIKKGINLNQVRIAFKWAKKARLTTTAYFMMGFPTETKEQVLDTIKLMEEIKPDNPLWSIVTPYPGTELYDIAKERNLLPKGDNWSHYFHHSPDMGLSENLSKEDMKYLMDEVQKRLDTINLKNNIRRKIERLLHPIETTQKIIIRLSLLAKKYSPID